MQYTNFNKGSSSALENPPQYLFMGRIARVDGATVFVEIPSLGPGFVVGPCTTVHSGINPIPQPGEMVVCGSIGNTSDYYVVLGRIANYEYSTIDGGSA